MNTIKNLVFQGGGVKGLVYVGAIQELESQGILSDIEGVAGTSAGSIISALLSLRYPPDKILEIMKATDMSSFMDRENIIKKIRNFGLHSGDVFLEWMQNLIKNSPLGLDSNATFQDFKAKGARDLHVYASDLFTQNVVHFSFGTTPNVVVAEAVRASMSIPVFFNAWQFSDNNPNDHFYADGGLLLNFPLFTFDDMGQPPSATLGMKPVNLSGKPVLHTFQKGQWIPFVKNTFEIILKSQIVELDAENAELRRIIKIDDFGISATDFDLTEPQKNELIQSGLDATKAHFHLT